MYGEDKCVEKSQTLKSNTRFPWSDSSQLRSQRSPERRQEGTATSTVQKEQSNWKSLDVISISAVLLLRSVESLLLEDLQH